MFYHRAKMTICSTYGELDIIPRTEEADWSAKMKRGEKKKVSEPKQKDLNEKNARRYFLQLVNGNFGIGDIHISLTFNKNHLPDTREEGEKVVNNYIRRVAYRRQKLGLTPLKYVLVSEYGEKNGRFHFHVILNGGIGRDELEVMWSNERINWKKYYKDQEYRNYLVTKQLGYANADKLQVNENGLEALVQYLTKNPGGKKRWSSSRNLNRPYMTKPSEKRFTRAQVVKMAGMPDNGQSILERLYPSWNFVSVKSEYHEETGWHLYARMWKRPQNKGKPKKKKEEAGCQEQLRNT